MYWSQHGGCSSRLVSPAFTMLGNDVESKMEAQRVPAHLFLLKSQFLRVRDRICGGDDAEPRWRNRGDEAHICFCSARSTVLRKKRARRAGFTREWTLRSPSQPAALLALGQQPHTRSARASGAKCGRLCVVFWVGPYSDASGQAATLSECLYSAL